MVALATFWVFVSVSTLFRMKKCVRHTIDSFLPILLQDYDMATRKRLTDEELFKLADEAQARWGTVTISALQQAAGGGSHARFKKIIAEWAERRQKGEQVSGSRNPRGRSRSKSEPAAVTEGLESVSEAPLDNAGGSEVDAADTDQQAVTPLQPESLTEGSEMTGDGATAQPDDQASRTHEPQNAAEGVISQPPIDRMDTEPEITEPAPEIPAGQTTDRSDPTPYGSSAATPPVFDQGTGAGRTVTELQAAYDRLLSELQTIRRAHQEETARLNRLIDVLMDEVRARR
jgi:hypothetical protein